MRIPVLLRKGRARLLKKGKQGWGLRDGYEYMWSLTERAQKVVGGWLWRCSNMLCVNLSSFLYNPALKS